MRDKTRITIQKQNKQTNKTTQENVERKFKSENTSPSVSSPYHLP